MITTRTDNVFMFKIHRDEDTSTDVEEEIPSVYDDGMYKKWWLFSICRLGLLKHTGIRDKSECKYRYDLDGSKLKVTGVDEVE